MWMKMLPRILMHVKLLSWEVVTIIKPRVTEYNHRGTERTEDERTENSIIRLPTRYS